MIMAEFYATLKNGKALNTTLLNTKLSDCSLHFDLFINACKCIKIAVVNEWHQ